MRRLVIAAILSLTATAVLADMYQDAGNAKLPDARNNLELGTVKSEGGDPPNAITRFYTWDGTHPQFQINSQPNAAEWGVEQAGWAGQGATRLCYSETSTVVNCNFAALGATATHRFGNGAGTLAQIGFSGTGPSNAYLTLLGGDDTVARLNADSGNFPDIDLEISTKGASATVFKSGTGGGAPLAKIVSSGGGAVNSYYTLVGGNTSSPGPRLLASSDTLPDVNARLIAKGIGAVALENANGNLALFSGTAATDGLFLFTQGQSGVASATLTSNIGAGIQITNHRLVMTTKTANYTITVQENGAHFDNIGATGAVTLTLPTAGRQQNFCFTVDAAFSLIVKAGAADKIALAATNSALAGTVSSAAPFASLCLESHKTGQWITRSTPDKAQWTVT